MVAARFDRVMAWLAWACRPALVLFPLLMVCEIAGLVPTEVTIPFAVMAAVHAAGRKAWLAARRDQEAASKTSWASSHSLSAAS
ncbi:hypothetical protein [Oleomonas cavernae]|uniref:hypothetical protein n=1 Tax=Oleomonas cavernae TaxID=2320859 RepID=UPI0011C38847|nr:hypothetical protein [Oleomonas cavernae]